MFVSVVASGAQQMHAPSSSTSPPVHPITLSDQSLSIPLSHSLHTPAELSVEVLRSVSRGEGAGVALQPLTPSERNVFNSANTPEKSIVSQLPLSVAIKSAPRVSFPDLLGVSSRVFETVVVVKCAENLNRLKTTHCPPDAGDHVWCSLAVQGHQRECTPITSPNSSSVWNWNCKATLVHRNIDDRISIKLYNSADYEPAGLLYEVRFCASKFASAKWITETHELALGATLSLAVRCREKGQKRSAILDPDRIRAEQQERKEAAVQRMQAGVTSPLHPDPSIRPPVDIVVTTVANTAATAPIVPLKMFGKHTEELTGSSKDLMQAEFPLVQRESDSFERVSPLQSVIGSVKSWLERRTARSTGAKGVATPTPRVHRRETFIALDEHGTPKLPAFRSRGLQPPTQKETGLRKAKSFDEQQRSSKKDQQRIPRMRSDSEIESTEHRKAGKKSGKSSRRSNSGKETKPLSHKKRDKKRSTNRDHGESGSGSGPESPLSLVRRINSMSSGGRQRSDSGIDSGGSNSNLNPKSITGVEERQSKLTIEPAQNCFVTSAPSIQITQPSVGIERTSSANSGMRSRSQKDRIEAELELRKARSAEGFVV